MGQRGRPRHPDVLTPREQDVLALIRDGRTNEQIAERLNIGFETAKSHVGEILSKLGVESREEAAAWRPERGGRFGRIVPAIGGTAVVAAAVAGLALLAWGLSRSDEGDDRSAAALSATPTLAASGAAPSATQAGVSAPNLLFRSFWMADASSGWLGGIVGACPYPGLGCTGVIYHTNDGGDSWDEQYSGPLQVSEIAFQDSDRGYAIGSTGGCEAGTCPIGILRTNDGGLHWDKLLTISAQLVHLAVSADDAWLLVQTCAPDRSSAGCTWDLRATSDGGDSWTVSTLPAGFAIEVSRPTVNDAWIVTSPAGPGTSEIIATHDDGQTWRTLPSPENGAGFEERIFFRSASEGWLMLAGQPGAGSELKEIFSTMDGGETWVHVGGSLAPPTGDSAPTSPLFESGYLGPLVFSTDTGGWMASPRLGLMHSADGGASWSTAVQDDNLSSVQFSDAQHGWALSLVNFWTTSDGGAT